ncbi:hypothetical protein GJ496_005563 [Pomphorhynchus laevis]|nr:hypothetical protein GJ496_005563 [Pomphorhynchus laevis]
MRSIPKIESLTIDEICDRVRSIIADEHHVISAVGYCRRKPRFSERNAYRNRDIRCYNCGLYGHIARFCRIQGNEKGGVVTQAQTSPIDHSHPAAYQ